MSAYLALEDGTIFRGESVGAPGVAFGEAVFTTAMTGYQETVTDPSFAEQLVCFTAPMVGNYGVADSRAESGGAHAKAVLMREARGPEWTGWLADHGHRRHQRDRHALARAPAARRWVVASGRGRGAAGRGRGARGRPRELPQMTGAALVAHVSTVAAVRLLRTRARCASRSSTTAASARFSAVSPRARRARDRVPVHESTPTSSSATTACSSRTAPATRSRS